MFTTKSKIDALIRKLGLSWDGRNVYGYPIDSRRLGEKIEALERFLEIEYVEYFNRFYQKKQSYERTKKHQKK